jgi:peptide/nickel transport system permease protein
MLTIPTLFGITVLIFLIMRVLPGDPLRTTGGDKRIVILSDEQVAIARLKLGLDRPLYIQYLSWMADVFRGDLGFSFFRTNEPIREVLQRRAPVSAQIAFFGVIFSWMIGVPVGVIAAMRRNSAIDYVSRVWVTLGMSVPNFWLALTLVIITVIFFQWKPPIISVQLWEDPWRSLQQTVPAAVIFALGGGALIARMSRSTLLEVLNEDYIRTARAKGLVDRTVLWRHALRNAMLPVVTMTGLMLAGILSGMVAVERALGIPGIGFTLINAMDRGDWMMIQNLVLFFGVIYVFLNLAVDLTYAWIDPRIRYQ